MHSPKSFVFAFIILVSLSACKGGKTVVGGATADATLSVGNLIASHNAASPNFNTLAARVQVVYKDEKKEQSITVSLRMEKDKTIWIKASLLGITLAKAIITPDRVSYYETISNTYFDGDFTLLSDWLGTDLDFDKTQAILLGQSIFDISKNSYESSVFNNKYQLEPKEQPSNFIHFLLLNPDNFKVHSGSLSQPREGRSLSLRYGDYSLVEGNFFPTKIFIKSSDDTGNTNIDVIYKKIDLNASVRFPFNIPEGYEEILLN